MSFRKAGPRVAAVAGLGFISSVAMANVSTVLLQTPSPLSVTDSTGTVYSLTATQPAGSGVFHPIMRMQHVGNEQGYNSSANNGPNATMDLINLPGNSSSQVPFDTALTSDNQVLLTLDYNEPGAAPKSTISLEELMVVVSTNPDKTGPAGPKNNGTWSIQAMPLDPGDAVLYDMSTATVGGNPFDIELNADANLANGNGGSGVADLNVAINLAANPNLASYLDGQHYLYVYSRFSGTQGGYEEWSAFQNGVGTTPVPEPAALATLGLGVVLVLGRRLNARRA